MKRTTRPLKFNTKTCLLGGTGLLFLALALFLITGCSTLNSAKLFAPESFGMEEIADNIYVDSNMEEWQQEQLLTSVETARQRIHLYYGSVVSEPQIFACSTEECFQAIGGVTARGKAYGASKLLLSPRGITAPMIAHEWSHAELHTRVGGFFKVKNIPRWFDEGLAVLVSDEPSHSEEVWKKMMASGTKIPHLTELETRKQWLTAARQYGDTSINPEKYSVVYTTAGHEVRSWYRKVGRVGLAKFIEEIRQDKPFKEAYCPLKEITRTACL